MAEKELILLALNPTPILDLMERTLRAAGFDVAVAHDRSGLDRSVQEAVPVLMIIGERFADQDGLSVSSDLLFRFPTLPILLYADRDASELAKAVLKNGLSGYLYPPLKMQEIVDEVQKSLVRAKRLGDWLRREVRRTTSSLSEKAAISEAERSKLEAIIAHIQDGVIVMDDHQKILLVNRSICDVFGLDGREITGKFLADVIPNADLKGMLTHSSEGSLKQHEINFDDGRVFNAHYTLIPKIGAAVTIQDISYLKQLDRLKNDFIYTVSHDLRSPLTSILGYAELIGRIGPLNQNQQDFLHRLQGSAQHITNLVNDLLDLGSLEAGFDTLREIVQLESILINSLDMFEGQLEKKNIKLSRNIETPLKPIHANPIRIRQMMDNLIGNAIKYTPNQGLVYVSVFMQDNQIILRVQDSGPGIPMEEQSHVFDKFYRASNAPEGVRGSGLGLSIVKSVVESHQGRVWVESVIGKGSVFIVILPALE